MAKIFKINKGLNIPLYGEANKRIKNTPANHFAIKPTDFEGIVPKLLVKENDNVNIGTPLFYSKMNDKIKFVSPVCGKITQIVRGEKRLLEEIRISTNNNEDYSLPKIENYENITQEQIISILLETGLWPTIRQRPYNIIANPDDKPTSVFISGFESSPLAPDFEFVFKNNITQLQVGIDIIKKLIDNKKIYLGLKDDTSIFNTLKNVEINYFQGPHPSGNIGTQINKIAPLNKNEVIWHISLSNLLIIAQLFLTQKLNFSKTIALSGSEVIEPCYYEMKIGESIDNIINNNISDTNCRFISGNVLTGTKIEKSGYLSFYDNQITVIPEGDYYEFLGWAMPGLKKYSFSKTFLSKLLPRQKFDFDTNYHGELRNFVVSGQYEKVFPLNILPVQLLKAIIIKDIDLMEQLGIYEVVEEDFALCEYICTSKIECQKLIRQGIEFIQKELS